jgi:hypothetical protein
LCEPVWIAPAAEDGVLFGRSKLNLHPYPDEVEEAAAQDPDEHDLRALVHILCGLSEKHHLTWELDVDGEFLGRIKDGVCDTAIYDGVDGLAEVAFDLGRIDRLEMFEEDESNGPSLRIWPEPDE